MINQVSGRRDWSGCGRVVRRIVRDLYGTMYGDHPMNSSARIGGDVVREIGVEGVNGMGSIESREDVVGGYIRGSFSLI